MPSATQLRATYTMHAALNFSQQIRAPAVQHTRRAVHNSRYRTITRAAAMEITVRIRLPVLSDLVCPEISSA